MVLHLIRAGVLLAAATSMGAGFAPRGHVLMAPAAAVKSQNFVVTAATPQLAQEVCQAAERFRRDLAIEWLGHELPPWRDICPIQVTVGRMGAGGATSFVFSNGEPRDWRMSIQGSRERILDSVLPHEITHMILATHIGCPLPRWADEGAATSVEHGSERAKQEQLLLRFLTSDRGIAFNRLFAMKDYPADIMPLYSQGYSLARFLIAQGGRQKYVQYVSDGTKGNNWTAATHKHYGFRSLSELQITWLDWVRDGSLDLVPDRQLAVAPPAGPVVPAGALASAIPAENSILVPLPPRGQVLSHAETPARSAMPDTRSSNPRDGWYARQRDLAAKVVDSGGSQDGATGPQQLSRPQPPAGPGQIILDGGQGQSSRVAATGTLLR
ncbi:MAG: hypothetical protein FJ276_30085 [Planctomycetes bacterium]|nr:hypothetical protein [Planctomycetota bacterium]